MSRKIKLSILLLFSFSAYCFAQEKEKPKISFIETEYMIGKLIPNQLIKEFPKTNPQQAFAMTLGGKSLDTNKWGRFYNFPESGVTLLFSDLGNNDIFGQMINVLPYVSFNVFNTLPGKSQLKIGLGVSYFNTKFDSISNPINEVIGSHFTWDVKVFLYHQLFQTNKFKLRAGIGFSHESNGHTKLPNLGSNSYLFSLNGQFSTKDYADFKSPSRIKRGNIAAKRYFINAQQSYGFHEQDGTEGPMKGRSKPVYSSSIAFGTIFNNHLKLRVGLVYRFYEQFNTHVTENEIEGLSDNPIAAASNAILFIGNEFLMSHASFDVRLGINLYKPFYRRFNEANDPGTVLRKIFTSRIGMNLYLKDTNKQPKSNFFIGAHINANMAKADFTAFSLGYSYLLSKH
jgi:hypothetical protein